MDDRRPNLTHNATFMSSVVIPEKYPEGKLLQQLQDCQEGADQGILTPDVITGKFKELYQVALDVQAKGIPGECITAYIRGRGKTYGVKKEKLTSVYTNFGETLCMRFETMNTTEGVDGFVRVCAYGDEDVKRQCREMGLKGQSGYYYAARGEWRYDKDTEE